VVATEIKTYAELEALQKNPSQFTDWMTEVVAQKLGVTPDAIAATLQRAIAKTRLPGAGTPVGSPGPDVWHKGPRFETAKKAGFARNGHIEQEYGGPRGDFETLCHYFEAIYSTKNGGQHPKLKAALAEAAGALGGFLVPEEYRMEIRMLQLETAQFRGKSVVIPMGAMIQHWPYVRDTSHVSSVYGGVIGYWEGEAQLLGESEPSFGQLQLTAHKLTAYTVIANEVMVDSSGAIETFVTQQFPKALNFFEERGFYKGNGAGQPLGALAAGNGALIEVTRDTTGHITYTDIVNMSTHILPSSENAVVWFASPSTKADLYQMSLNIGTGGSAVFINPLTGGAANTPPNTIFGRPLIFTEHMAALGSTNDIACLDLSYYLIGDRQAMSMEASPHVKFVNDQTVYRLIQRLDGRPWLDAALTLEDGVTTVSPFIGLSQ